MNREPLPLTRIKNHPSSICLKCVNLHRNCNVATSKTIHRGKVKDRLGLRDFVMGCDKLQKLLQ